MNAADWELYKLRDLERLALNCDAIDARLDIIQAGIERLKGTPRPEDVDALRELYGAGPRSGGGS